MGSPLNIHQVSFPRVQGPWQRCQRKMTSHILVSCGLLGIPQLQVRLNSVNLHRRGSLSSLPRSCCVLRFVQPAPAAKRTLGFPGYLLDPCRHSKMNLKTSTVRAGRGYEKGRGVGMESKSGEVCSPLVCNFQNDSRTRAKVRESEALSTSASCGREAWSSQDARLYKSTVSRACWRWGQWAHTGLGSGTMVPGQCAGPEQMCPGTTGAPICETNWPTIEKLDLLQQPWEEKQAAHKSLT